MTKFSIGGNSGKKLVAEELDDLKDDYEEEEERTSASKKNSNNDDKTKIIKMMILLLAIVIGGILLLFFVTSLSSGNKTYEEIEEIMVVAAKSYFKEHPENLPKRDGGTQTVDISVLVAEEKMKDLSKYTDSLCTGTVKVEKSGSEYLYVPKLNCGEYYISEELHKKVRTDSSVVSSGYGLYNKGRNYVFRGENVNNYVQLDNALWRIVKITSSDNLVLVMDEPLQTLIPWDDRYNQETNYNAGINNYQSSRIKEKLNELYTTTDQDITQVFLSDSDKSKLISFNMCIGKRAETETGVEQAVECTEMARDIKVGLLTASDYMNASIDPSCTTASSLNCQNYNYLLTDMNWWTVTACTKDSHCAYMVEANSGLKAANTLMYARIRPVIHLNTNVLYKSGTGTKNDPYTVK